jgi:hypothetical protein
MNKISLTKLFGRSLILGAIASSSLISPNWVSQAAGATMKAYCQFSSDAIAAKESLLQAALKNNSNAEKDYKTLLKQHAEMLRQCRARTWPRQQAIWLRLYPCDVRPGSIDAILDRIVNRGYNTIYLEVFSDSQVLLPSANNPTAWDGVVRTRGAEKVDLLAETIQKGHERGLIVYAWLFTMNFGYVYAQRPDRQGVLARNGKGENSLSFVHDQSQAFIDPYHPQAQADYALLIQEVLKRRPDGILFDYVRYPRGTGNQSAVGEVKDLWIYGEASRQVLRNRAQNNKGLALIERYVNQGYITVQDVSTIDKLYPQEGSPLWQGRNPSATEMQESVDARFQRWKMELWYLTVAHAAQGVIDFLAWAALPAQRQGIPAGAVFFPDGNQVVGTKGFDSRLQAWDKFPPSLEWHPMAYALCNDAKCIVEQVRRVRSMAPAQTEVIPALAGLWGKEDNKRPSLEAQMQAIQSAFPQIKSVSHFAFSWQEPQFDKERRFCKM